MLHNQLHDPLKGSFHPLRTTRRILVQVEYYCSPLVAFFDNFAWCCGLLVNQACHQSYGMLIQVSRDSICSHQLPCILFDNVHLDGEWWYFEVIGA